MQDRSMETAEKSASKPQQTPKPRGRPFVPGDPRGKPGPGRPRKTDEYRMLEAMTRRQVAEACDKIVGLAVERVVKILQKGDDATAWRAAESFISRSIGPVPSAQYISAQVSSGGVDARLATVDEMKLLAREYVAKLDAEERNDE
jgi:hypothetical protein